jgi:hypothetical protein
MATLRTTTMGIGDWAANINGGDSNSAEEWLLPTPFNGYVERIYYGASADVTGTGSALIININGGSNLSTLTLGPGNVAGVPVESSFNQSDSPVNFAEGDCLVLSTDGNGAATTVSGITVVLRRV